LVLYRKNQETRYTLYAKVVPDGCIIVPAILFTDTKDEKQTVVQTDNTHREEELKPVLIIPTYNNHKTIATVIDKCRQHIENIIVVNDGSTDSTTDILSAIPSIEVLSYTKNQGKGRALQTGFNHARKMGYTHAITIDADLQHLAEDIPLFLSKIGEEPHSLCIGNRVLNYQDSVQPGRSKFGAKFGAFWFKFHSGIPLQDTQCGFRAYPLSLFDTITSGLSKYEYELDILIKAAWAGYRITEIPIHLFYQNEKERVSHFRPLRDFFRIGLINARAAMTRIFFPWRFIDAPGASTKEKVMYLVRQELSVHHDPAKAAFAIALGACLGLSPMHGMQVITLLTLTVAFKLNKALAFLGVTISSPPLTPFWIALEYVIGKEIFPASIIIHWGKALSRAGLAPLVQFVLTVSSGLGAALEKAGLEQAGEWLSQDGNTVAIAVAVIQFSVGSFIIAPVIGLIIFLICWPIFVKYQKFKLNRGLSLKKTELP